MNQRHIAKKLGISQVAVSLALRNDLSVSVNLRKRVKAMAKSLGYQPNPYVSALMTHIRTSRKPCEKGSLALLVDVLKAREWDSHESYRVYYKGVVRRCAELGFNLVRFFLNESGMRSHDVDKILHAQGIRGLILAPPYLGNKKLAIQWERYACVGTGYGWAEQQLDRVAHDHDENVVIAFQKLSELGYRRIGMCVSPFYANGRGTRWLDGFLACQYRLPQKQQIPLFVGSVEDHSFPKFRQWYRKWKPDVLVSTYGHEKQWLDELGLRVPKDIGMAYLIRPAKSDCAGIDDRYEHIGATTVELVASKITFNQYGIPTIPKMILIAGRWLNGKSVSSQD